MRVITAASVTNPTIPDGEGFETTQAVSFNGTGAAFTVDADTLLRATVPAGATSCPITVTNPAGRTRAQRRSRCSRE